MENVNIQKMISKVYNVINNKKEDVYGDLYSKYSSIYLAPTSNVIDTVNLFDASKINKALVVGTSGAYIYELLLKGVKEIDAFDINIYQYFYYELLKAAIKSLNYADFMECFTSKNVGLGQDMSNMFNSYVMFDVFEKIEEPARSFWIQLFTESRLSFNSLINTNLFRYEYKLYPEYLKKYSSIYNVDDFYNLQDILLGNDIDINYKISEIENVPSVFNGKKYDLVIFDNILQYYKRIPHLNNFYKVDKFIKNDIKNMLSDDGVVQVDYGFEVASYAVCKVIDRKIPNMTQADALLLEMSKEFIKKEKKEGIISNIARKYNDYSINFIPGVEINPFFRHYPENVVLTYKKNHK